MSSHLAHFDSIQPIKYKTADEEFLLCSHWPNARSIGVRYSASGPKGEAGALWPHPLLAVERPASKALVAQSTLVIIGVAQPETKGHTP